MSALPVGNSMVVRSNITGGAVVVPEWLGQWALENGRAVPYEVTARERAEAKASQQFNEKCRELARMAGFIDQ